MFFQLTKYITVPIYFNWISPFDLGKLDTSVCNATSRKLFLSTFIIGFNSAVFDTFKMHALNLSFLKWILERKISLTNFNVHQNILRKIELQNCHENVFSNLIGFQLTKMTKKYCYEQMPHLISRCISLTNFVLQESDFFGGEIVQTLATYGAKTITHLSIELASTSIVESVTNVEWLEFIKRLENLTDISIVNYSELSDDNVHIIAQMCHKLKSIQIKKAPNISNDSMNSILSFPPDLTSVDVSELPKVKFHLLIKHSFLDGPFSNRLRHIYFCRHETPRWNDPSVFLREGDFTSQQCALIHTLSLKNVEVTSDALQSLTDSCANLTTLRIKHTHERVGSLSLPYGSMLYFVKHCSSQLQIISLAGNRNVKEQLIITLAIRCSCLVELDVSNCEQISFKLIRTLALHCIQLQVLDMSQLTNTYMLSDEDLNIFFNGCRKVKTLNIGKNFKWSSPLPLFDTSNCTELRHFGIDGYKVTTEVAEKLRMLKKLKLFR